MSMGTPVDIIAQVFSRKHYAANAGAASVMGHSKMYRYDST